MVRNLQHLLGAALAALAVMVPAAPAANLDFRNAAIVIPAGASVPERKAAAMLAEEIEKRTQLRLKVQTAAASGAAFVLGRAGQVPAALAGVPEKAEGFTLRSSAAGAAPVAVVTGYDDRGVVFGTGYLLRQLDMGRQRLELAADLHVTEAPAVAVRGHQLGYRPKTNAYDAWGVARWEQYIRELAIFGVNTIELIPPRSDDAADSPHFPLPQMEMMVEMSRIADEYGLDVSIWYPAMDADYADPKTVDFALREWGEVFRRLPRIDAVFVPGGDPGHTRTEIHDGAARKAGRQPAPVPSQGANVDVAAGVHQGVDGRVFRPHEGGAGVAGGGGVRATADVRRGGTAPADSAALRHPLLSGHHAQHPLAVSGAGLGRGVCADGGAGGHQPAAHGGGFDFSLGGGGDDWVRQLLGGLQ